MNALADILPLIAFFVLYKLKGIYVATAAAVVLSVLGAAFKFRSQGKLDPLPLFGVALMVIFGGLTLYFQDPRFLIWKPTLAYTATAVFFAWSCLPGRTPLVQRMFQSAMHLRPLQWRNATLAYVVFFVFKAIVNLIVAYSFSFDTWVMYKVWGTIVLSFGFMLGHAWYYSSRQHFPPTPVQESVTSTPAS